MSLNHRHGWQIPVSFLSHLVCVGQCWPYFGNPTFRMLGQCCVFSLSISGRLIKVIRLHPGQQRYDSFFILAQLPQLVLGRCSFYIGPITPASIGQFSFYIGPITPASIGPIQFLYWANYPRAVLGQLWTHKLESGWIDGYVCFTRSGHTLLLILDVRISYTPISIDILHTMLLKESVLTARSRA